MNDLRIIMLIPLAMLMSLIIASCSSDDNEEHFIFMPSHKDKKLVSMTYTDYNIDSTIDDQIQISFYYDGHERLNKVEWDWYYSSSEEIQHSNKINTFEWKGNEVISHSNETYILNNDGLIISLDGGTLRYDSNNRPVYYKSYNDERNIVWNTDNVNYVIDEEGDSISFSYSKTLAKGCNFLLLRNIHIDLSWCELSFVHPELLGMDFESQLLSQVKHNGLYKSINNYTYEISDDGYIESIKEEEEETISGKRYVFLGRVVKYQWE